MNIQKMISTSRSPLFEPPAYIRHHPGPFPREYRSICSNLWKQSSVLLAVIEGKEDMAMALCDICNTPGMGTSVKAKNMSNAVRKGFDPFKEGLASGALGLMGAFGLGGSGPDAWRQSAINGPLSKSDWNVCDRCMTKLKPYLAQSSSCFIATACYGSFTCQEVLRLRQFRDEKLLPSHIGRFAVRSYYFLSPTGADVLRKHPRVAELIRTRILSPVLKAVEKP